MNTTNVFTAQDTAESLARLAQLLDSKIDFESAPAEFVRDTWILAVEYMALVAEIYAMADDEEGGELCN